jgi:hypothetical protein
MLAATFFMAHALGRAGATARWGAKKDRPQTGLRASQYFPNS